MAILILLITLVPACLTELVAWKIPPRKYNPYRGYKSHRANMTEATWTFAQTYSGRVGFHSAFILLLTGIPAVLLINYYLNSSTASVFAFSLMIAQHVISYYLTERKLKQLFDENGKLIK